MENDENIFEISKEWVQLESNQLIGRDLTEEEIYSVQKVLKVAY